MQMRFMWMLGWLVGLSGAVSATPSHSGGPTGFQGPVSRPRAPQSLETPTQNFPALSVIDFVSVVGSVPSASLQSIVPRNDSEKMNWDARLSQWRGEQKQFSDRVNALVSKQRTHLTADTAGALVALKGQIEGWRNRDKAGEFGGQIFSDEARSLAQDSASLLVSYAEAYAALDLDPGQSRLEKERIAFERALKAHPETSLTEVDQKAVDRLPSHHKSQIQRLSALRNALRSPGNLETFAASLRKDTRPARQIQTLAHR